MSRRPRAPKGLESSIPAYFPKMIKLSSCNPIDNLHLSISFSDGTTGIWNAAPLLGSKDTPLTVPLRQPEAFAKVFIDNGALAWPNGL